MALTVHILIDEYAHSPESAEHRKYDQIIEDEKEVKLCRNMHLSASLGKLTLPC